MFANNEKISWHQGKCQLLLSFISPVLLYLSGGNSREGILGAGLGILAIEALVFFLLRQLHAYRYPKKYWGKWGSGLLNLVFLSYLVFAGTWIVKEMTVLIERYFMSNFPLWLLSGMIILVALGGNQHLQARGRLAQVSWPVVRVLLLLGVFVAAFQVEWESLQVVNEISWDTGSIGNHTMETIVILSGMMLFPFAAAQMDPSADQKKQIFFGIGELFLWIVCGKLLVEAGLGRQTELRFSYPIVDVMAGIHLPGGVMQRMDLVFLVILLFGLFFSLGSIFFYGKLVCERMDHKFPRYGVGVLCFLLINVPMEYPALIRYLYVPIFFVILLCTGFLKKNGLLVSLIIPFLLTGCVSVEPEDRAYPLAAGITGQEDSFLLYLDMASLNQETGQEKDEEKNQDTVMLEGASKKEIQEAYEEKHEKYLDMGHIKVIVFQKDFLEQEGSIGMLENLEKDPAVGNGSYVFCSENVEAVFAQNEQSDTELAEFLIGMYENREKKKQPVTLANCCREYANTGKFPKLPQVEVDENGWKVEGLENKS